MTTFGTNPTVTISTSATPANPPAPNKASPYSSAKDGKAKQHGTQPTVLDIAADSTFSLFPQAPSNHARLDGEYTATVTAVQTVEQPARERTGGRKQGRKAKGGKGKQTPKNKTPKPGTKLLRLTFTLDHQRADGMTYCVEKDLRPKRNKESKFGEFMKGILADAESFERFFSDFKPAQLLNRRCTLGIKESRRQGLSNFKISNVQPAPSVAPEFCHSGNIGNRVTGHISADAVELTAIAA